MSDFNEKLTTVLVAIVGVAIVAVLVSNKSNTVGVIQAAASGFGNALNVAVSPVTGSSVAGNLSYPSSMGGFGNLSMPNINGIG